MEKRTTKQFEGFEEYPYYDTKGKLTSGYGFNLEDPYILSMLPPEYISTLNNGSIEDLQMTKEMADPVFKKLYDNASAEAKKFIGKGYAETDPEAIGVTNDLFYNMGNTKLQDFTGYQKAIKAKDFDTAAEEIKWHNPVTKKKLTGYWTDTKSRAKQHYDTLKNIKTKQLEAEMIRQLGGE